MQRREWNRVRELILGGSPYCAMCGLLATEVDHLDGADYRDDSAVGVSWLNPDMCRSLCRQCHRARTSRQGNLASRGLLPTTRELGVISRGRDTEDESGPYIM